MNTNPFGIVDLFAGPGGLDTAAHWLGIRAKGIEWDTGACETRRAAGLETKESDVATEDSTAYLDFNVLAAGPPCQTFTVAGRGTGREALGEVQRLVRRCVAGEDISAGVSKFSDVRTGLVLQPLYWILSRLRIEVPFDAIVLEQVPAVLPLWHVFEEALQSMGYYTDADILHTEEFGVPQTRRRAVLIANRSFQPNLPTPTHQRFPQKRGVERELGDRTPWTSIRDAMSVIPDGESCSMYEMVSNYGTGGNPEMRGRRNLDEPAFTVTGKISRNRFVDRTGRDRRRIQPAEAGVLQTFPFDFPWKGKDVSQQIGNAIPPRLGVYVLAAALGLQFDVSDLDKAVRLSWATSQSGCIPTAPIPGTALP